MLYRRLVACIHALICPDQAQQAALSSFRPNSKAIVSNFSVGMPMAGTQNMSENYFIRQSAMHAVQTRADLNFTGLIYVPLGFGFRRSKSCSCSIADAKSTVQSAYTRDARPPWLVCVVVASHYLAKAFVRCDSGD